MSTWAGWPLRSSLPWTLTRFSAAGQPLTGTAARKQRLQRTTYRAGRRIVAFLERDRAVRRVEGRAAEPPAPRPRRVRSEIVQDLPVHPVAEVEEGGGVDAVGD